MIKAKQDNTIHNASLLLKPHQSPSLVLPGLNVPGILWLCSVSGTSLVSALSPRYPLPYLPRNGGKLKNQECWVPSVSIPLTLGPGKALLRGSSVSCLTCSCSPWRLPSSCHNSTRTWVWSECAPVRLSSCEDTVTAQSRPQTDPLPATQTLASAHLSQTKVGKELGGKTIELSLEALSKHLLST